MIRSVIVGISHMANTTGEEGSMGTSTKRKRESIESRKGNAKVAITVIANHRPSNNSGKILQFEASRNTHLQAKGNLE